MVLLAIACATPHPTTPLDPESAAPHGTQDTFSDSEVSTDSSAPQDDARVVEADFPAELKCERGATGLLSIENTGTTTWTRAEGIKLGVLDDEDPFYGPDTRVWLPDDAVVAPGDRWDFVIDLMAPGEAGSYATDWGMVRENVRWFGQEFRTEIEVACEAPEEPGPPDLDEVIWLHTDVSDWVVTGTLASVTVTDSQICLDYDKADEWPSDSPDGDAVVANPWIFIFHEGQWYGATWEWMRPGQTCKNRHAVAGDHIKQSPFDASSGWTPTSGETYYFMLSGLARLSERTVFERTNLLEVVWP